MKDHKKPWTEMDSLDKPPKQKKMDKRFGTWNEYASSKVQENKVGLKVNGTHQLLVYAEVVNLLSGNVHTIKKNRNFN
jgi:hypothetical protein